MPTTCTQFKLLSTNRTWILVGYTCLTTSKYSHWSFSYSAIPCFRADSLRSCRMWFRMSDVWIANEVGVLTALFICNMADATWNCCRLGTHSVYTIQQFTSLQCHFIRSHTYVGACMFSCNLPPALLAEWPGSCTCYCGNTWVERIPK